MKTPQDLSLAIQCASGLAALTFYLQMVLRGKSAMLQAMLRSSDSMYRHERALFLLAIAGFVVCMFMGAEAMLVWIPEDASLWGMIQVAATVKAILAACLTFMGGEAFFRLIDAAARGKFLARKRAAFSS